MTKKQLITILDQAVGNYDNGKGLVVSSEVLKDNILGMWENSEHTKAINELDKWYQTVN